MSKMYGIIGLEVPLQRLLREFITQQEVRRRKMLVDFTVENFRSIKEPATLSAVAQKSKIVPSSNDSMRRIKTDDEIAPPFPVEGWGFELLPVLTIFGANASGKSNVISALDYLITSMCIAHNSELNHFARLFPFMLDSATHKMPSRFELRTAFKGTVYTYTLHLTRARVMFERLHYAPASTKKDRLLYQRTWSQDNACYDWKIGDKFAGPQTQLKSSLNERESFMSLLVRLDIPVIAPLVHWLMHHLMGIGHGGYERLDEWGAAQTAHKSSELLSRISKIVCLFDTGISRFEVVKADSEPEDFEIWAWHPTDQGEMKMPLPFESTGTRRLFGLANNILKAFDEATLLLVDELGSNIHPNITRELVKMFQSPRTNPKRAQLIFTSHDNTLQRGQLLRRDQIWFTQKRVDGSTELYPLSDFKPRNDTAIDKSYLDGRYGAVPLLPDEDELAAITTGQRDAA